MNIVMNLRLPFNTWHFLTSCGTVSVSGRTLLRGVSQSIFGFTFSVAFGPEFSCHPFKHLWPQSSASGHINS